MKNKEKYVKEIIDVSCNGYCFGMDNRTGKITSCNHIQCCNCVFSGDNDCDKTRREWSEQEYIEKTVISKRDRAFLECIGEGIKYITRDMNGFLFIYVIKPHKLIDCWESGGIESNKSLEFFKLNLPMVKWSDKEPWLIEDLKKLEVVEEYN